MQGNVARKERLVLDGSVNETTGAMRVHDIIAMMQTTRKRQQLQLQLRADV